MYDPKAFASGRGIAAVVRDRLAGLAGHREREVLEAPDVDVRRWDGGHGCLEFRNPATGSTIVVSRDNRIVG